MWKIAAYDLGEVARVGVRGENVDDLVGQAGEVRGLPVVLPAVGDGVVDAALMVDVQGGTDQIHERGPELAQRTDGTLTVFDGSGVAAGDGDCRPEVEVLVDNRPAAGSCRAGRCS